MWISSLHEGSAIIPDTSFELSDLIYIPGRRKVPTENENRIRRRGRSIMINAKYYIFGLEIFITLTIYKKGSPSELTNGIRRWCYFWDAYIQLLHVDNHQLWTVDHCKSRVLNIDGSEWHLVRARILFHWNFKRRYFWITRKGSLEKWFLLHWEQLQYLHVTALSVIIIETQ